MDSIISVIIWITIIALGAFFNKKKVTSGEFPFPQDEAAEFEEEQPNPEWETIPAQPVLRRQHQSNAPLADRTAKQPAPAKACEAQSPSNPHTSLSQTKKALKTPSGARKAFLYAEILGKAKGME